MAFISYLITSIRLPKTHPLRQNNFIETSYKMAFFLNRTILNLCCSSTAYPKFQVYRSGSGWGLSADKPYLRIILVNDKKRAAYQAGRTTPIRHGSFISENAKIFTWSITMHLWPLNSHFFLGLTICKDTFFQKTSKKLESDLVYSFVQQIRLSESNLFP